MKKIFCLITLLAYSTQQIHTKLISGDINAAPGTSFSVNLGFAAYDIQSENSSARWWLATNDATITTAADETKKFGLSFFNKSLAYVSPNLVMQAVPMANSQDATIYSWNGTTVATSTTPNPIYGGVFSNFIVSNHKPFFTVTQTPTIFYSVHDIQHFESPSTKPNVTDLLSYDFGAGQVIPAISGWNDTGYAAHAVGSFATSAPMATSTSKITELQRSVDNDTSNDRKASGLPYLKLLASAPVGVDTPAIKAGASQPDVMCIADAVAFGVAYNLTYVGLVVTASGTGNAVGIVLPKLKTTTVDNVTTTTLELDQIAPTSVLTVGFNTVVSAAGSNPAPSNTVAITQIAGMQTSTCLQYMIVARTDCTNQETIYALPILITGDHIGTIADFTSVTSLFGEQQPTFRARYFKDQISDATQIDPTNSAVAAQLKVGGDLPLDAGNFIKNMFVVGDCVYAVLAGEYSTTQQPGTFKSQAIFAPDGHIIAWTPWTRVLGSDKQMIYGFVDNESLVGMYIGAQTPSATPAFNCVYQTTFDATSNLSLFLQTTSTIDGKTQGLFDFNSSTPGFNGKCSMLISTGFNSVTLGQTGYQTGGIFEIKPMTSSDIIFYNSVNNQHAIVAAEIAYSGPNSWIFAGGISGLSVLTDDTAGYTWTGDLTSVASLNSDTITWKKVGNFSNIKKLIWDNGYIYILTSAGLYRILLDPAKFKAVPTASLQVETVVTSADFTTNPYMLDCIIDNGYCLIGTTNGLFVFDKSTNTKQSIALHQGLAAISKITAIASNANPNRSFKDLSNITVLNNTFGTQQARIYRLVIQDGVINLLPDTLVAQQGSTSQGVASSLIIFNNYISNYFSDGSWNIASSYYLGPNQPDDSQMDAIVLQIKSGVHSGLSSTGLIMKTLTKESPLRFINPTSNIINMVRETTSGALISAGDFLSHANV